MGPLERDEYMHSYNNQIKSMVSKIGSCELCMSGLKCEDHAFKQEAEPEKS